MAEPTLATPLLLPPPMQCAGYEIKPLGAGGHEVLLVEMAVTATAHNTTNMARIRCDNVWVGGCCRWMLLGETKCQKLSGCGFDMTFPT
jgi:hypothetical protein